MNTNKKGIGIIGIDHWYWAFGCAYSIALNPDAELIAIAASDPAAPDAKRVEVTANVYKAKTWYEDYRKLLENPKIGAVLITSTTNRHASIVKDATAAGKHILLGKPIARTLGEADQIIEATKKAKVKLMVLDSPVGSRYLKELLDKGTIGKPYLAHDFLWAIVPFAKPGVKEPGWFADPYKAAGGAFIDHAIYQAGKLRWFFGSEAKTVYAQMGKFVLKDWAIEDHGLAVVRLKDDSIVTLEASNTAPGHSHERTIIIGSEGEIEISGTTVSIWTKKGPYSDRHLIEKVGPPLLYGKSFAEIPVPTPPYAEGNKPMINEFIRCLVKDKNPDFTGEDSRANLEICLAAYESARTGEVVNLPLKTEVDVPSILAKL